MLYDIEWYKYNILKHNLRTNKKNIFKKLISNVQ